MLLTEQEIRQIEHTTASRSYLDHARAIEAKVIEKIKAQEGIMLTFPPPPSKETLESSGHRLALELECLLLDCKDNVVVSRWMDSACEALDAWRELFPYTGPRLGA